MSAVKKATKLLTFSIYSTAKISSLKKSPLGDFGVIRLFKTRLINSI